VIDAWLRSSASRHAAARLEAEARAYYSSLTAEDRAEDDEWANFSGEQFARLSGRPKRRKK
jgi:hypothetical protein